MICIFGFACAKKNNVFLLMRLIWAFKKLSFGFRPQSDTNRVVQQVDRKPVISDIYIYIYMKKRNFEIIEVEKF